MTRSAISPAFLLVFLLSGCMPLHGSLSGNDAVISIFNTGEGIVARPAEVTLAPGQAVVFSNHSDYEISLDLEFQNGEKRAVGIIPPLADNRVPLAEEGEVRYVLNFTSARNFGTISGKLIVEGAGGENDETVPAPDQTPEPSPPSNPEPVII